MLASHPSPAAAVRWAWRWVVLVLVLSSVAYLFAYWVSPADQVFLGFLSNNDDNQLYLSYMREGAQGAWLTTVRFTPELHKPALLLPLYQFLGKIARVIGLSNELVFHCARLLGGVGLLAVAYWFAASCLPKADARRSAFLMVCFSSGLGWLLTITLLADTLVVPVDIRIPESSTFLTIFTSPHFVLGVMLELLTLLFYLRSGEHKGYLPASALCLVLLSITLVYNVIVVASVLVVYTAILCIQRRRLWIPELWRTVAVGLPSVPVVGYYYWLLKMAPFWRVVYGDHDVVHSPGPVALVLGYGIVFGLAVWGLVCWVRQRQWSLSRTLVATWAVVNGLLLYVPLPFQGKLIAGWHVGLCIVAAAGLHEGLLPWVRRQSWFRRWATNALGPRASATVRNVVLILSIPSTLLVALIGFRIALAERYFPYFLPADDVEAVHWLASQTGEEDVLLSSYGIGNYWVAHSEGRAFLGHQFAVLDPQSKARAVHRIYAGQMDDDELRQMVDAYSIDYVFYGALERELGDFDPGLVAWLLPVHQSGEVTVYRVGTAER